MPNTTHKDSMFNKTHFHAKTTPG